MLIHFSFSGANSDICMTEECVLAAASFIKSMDRTVDPCEDFYSYACGKYAKETPIPQFAASVSVMGTMRENMEYKLSQLISYNIPANASGTDKTIKDFYMSEFYVSFNTNGSLNSTDCKYYVLIFI